MGRLLPVRYPQSLIALADLWAPPTVPRGRTVSLTGIFDTWHGQDGSRHQGRYVIVGALWIHWKHAAYCGGEHPDPFLQQPILKAAMLVLSRKKNESIVIRDDIVVTVVEIHGDKVRIGIEAPKEVTVHRREVYEKIKESGRDKDSPRQDAASEK